MRTVSQKVYGIIFGFSVSVVMSTAMSFVLVILNVGFVEDFMIVWIKSAGLGFLVAFPVASISIPLIQRLLKKHLTVAA